VIKTTASGRLVIGRLICDKCHCEIAISKADSVIKAEDGLPSQKYKDLNRGHECTECRRKRELAYDVFVTTPRDQE
jgi:hypothetical protein